VSFWRTGVEDWTRAQVNTPVAPGDALYTAAAANAELQIGPRAYLRAGADTQLGLENQEPDFLQFKVTAGHASLDVRSLTRGHTIEIDTPNGAFTIEATGYYRFDITNNTTTFVTRRGGRATVTPPGGETSAIAPSEEVVIVGADNPSLETYVAPEIDAWDRWNYDRTDHLIDALSARYVPSGVYGTDALDHYGAWRVTADYGPVWVPAGVAPGWAPYSLGRWIWDPYYGWTWVDQAPWGWAPYHYGRWVSVNGFWGWTPGPLVVTPVYSPALVAFFGGSHFGVSIGIGAPAVGWVALGWGEPLVPWWGRPGFIGHPCWGGWGGPRVVNNVVINNKTVVNVTNINTYHNVRVRNAVIAARQDRFGRGGPDHIHVREVDARQLEPLHGRLPVQPVAESLAPRVGHARRPTEATSRRPVVGTRLPHDAAASLRAEGLNVPQSAAPAPRIVSGRPVPHSTLVAPRPPFGQHGTRERQRPPLPPRFGGSGQPEQAQPRPRRAPARPSHEPRQVQPAPETNAPSGQMSAPRIREPRRPEAREPAPRAPVPEQRQPAPPPPERRAPAAQPAPPPRNLPGEPANRLYRGAPAMGGPHPNAAAGPQGNPQPGHESGRQGRGESTR